MMDFTEEDDFWPHIAEAFDQVDIYQTGEVFLETAAQFPEWKIDLLAIHWTDSEVTNGGLEQYFYNGTGILAPEAVAGFRKIGRNDFADVLQEAVDLLGEPYPRDREARFERLTQLFSWLNLSSGSSESIGHFLESELGITITENPFEELNDRYYELEHFAPDAVRYAESNSESE